MFFTQIFVLYVIKLTICVLLVLLINLTLSQLPNPGSIPLFLKMDFTYLISLAIEMTESKELEEVSVFILTTLLRSKESNLFYVILLLNVSGLIFQILISFSYAFTYLRILFSINIKKFILTSFLTLILFF